MEVEAGGACGKLVPFSLLKRARRFARLELFDLPIERRECGRKGMRRKGKRVGWVWRGYIVLVVWLSIVLLCFLFFVFIVVISFAVVFSFVLLFQLLFSLSFLVSSSFV